jgi:MoxR-like ATPase
MGKSSIVRQAAQAMNMDIVDLRAVLLDPVDLRGLPVVSKGDGGESVVDWAPPRFLPLKGRVGGRKGIIFADELAQAAPLVQAAFLQGILDHRIGEAELDPDWVWVAASNRQEDRAGAHRLISPLLNRFVHLDVEVSMDDWQAWALKNGVCPEVRSFLHWKDLLLDFDPARNQRAFPTPRSWEFVSNLVQHTPADLLHHVVAGAVGEGAAVEFTAFVQIYRDLPDPDQVLAQPASFKVPTDASVLFALVGALVDRIKTADKEKLGRFVAVIARLPQEYGMLAFRDGAQVNRQVMFAPGASPWMAQQKSYTITQPVVA